MKSRLIGTMLGLAALNACSLFESNENKGPRITSVSPATLSSGESATISGSGFGATIGENTVTIDGLPATVTAATATSLTVTVPTFPCAPSHSGAVVVTAGGKTAETSQTIQPGTAHNLAIGASVILSTPAAVQCNELHNANTNAMYYVDVYNTSPNYTTTGAGFELKGTAGSTSSLLAGPVASLRLPALRSAPRRARSVGEQDDSTHVALLERDLAFLRQNGRRWAGRDRGARLALGGTATALGVGDAMNVRIRNLDNDSPGCQQYLNISGRVAYAGPKAIIVEDLANPLQNIDTTYAQIGQEFETVMLPILDANFGNVLINDAVLDNNQRFVMVFSVKVNNMAGGALAGFVTACDYFPQSTYASSNVGEYFYARVPTIPGTVNSNVPGQTSPPQWRWAMRSTIIHEVKHIVSTSERFAKGNNFEESWLEESTARMSEELYERARYGFPQRGNIGYGSSGNPVGPWCGVRACGGQARGIVRVFEELGPNWYQAPHLYSPIGRIDASDFSFYSTAWSLLRWTIDANASKTEAAILKGMTQEPTLTGLANFNNQMGMTFAEALPKWTLAMVVDDYPSFTPLDATLKQPSWNLRDVFAGYKTDFPSAAFLSWPFAPPALTFGSFSSIGTVRPGTAAILQLSGTQTAKQLLQLKASGSSSAAPAELRMAIVRIK